MSVYNLAMISVLSSQGKFDNKKPSELKVLAKNDWANFIVLLLIKNYSKTVIHELN